MPNGIFNGTLVRAMFLFGLLAAMFAALMPAFGLPLGIGAFIAALIVGMTNVSKSEEQIAVLVHLGFALGGVAGLATSAQLVPIVGELASLLITSISAFLTAAGTVFLIAKAFKLYGRK